MSIAIKRALDFGNTAGITNLAQSTAAGQPVVHEQLNALLEGLDWKDNVRVAALTNVNLDSPGATVDGVSLSNGDRFLAAGQTSQPENGIYIYNGSGSTATRSTDASTFTELRSAVVTAVAGTSAGAGFRQTQLDGVIGTNNVIWESFGAIANASETVAGKAELATQGETDTGTDDARIITPLKLATWANRPKRFSASIGDGSATSIVVTHNLGTSDVVIFARETGGDKREVAVEKQVTDNNTATLIFDVAPTSNAIRVTVLA